MLVTLVMQFKCFHSEKTLVMLRKYLDTFVSLLQKALLVELKLFNMDCLKNIPITENSNYSIYYEHRPVNYIIMFQVNQSLPVQ